MNSNRRKFLEVGGKVTLLAIGAFNFGCSIQPLVKNKDQKVAIIYATRYGATKEMATWIQHGLSRKADLLNIETMSLADTLSQYDFIIIGSGIWIDGVHEKMLKFLETQKEQLKSKIVASFIVCGTTGKDVKGEERIENYFEKFHAPLVEKPPLNEHFGGRIVIDELNPKDRKMLEMFYKKVLKRKFKSWDRTQPEKAKLFGEKSLEIISSYKV